MATPQQFEDALAAIQKGPLPPAVASPLARAQQSAGAIVTGLFASVG
jgi:hypothetical protein